MSVLSYNGVFLPYCKTNLYEMSAIEEDVGGVDWYLTEFNISVQCLINFNYLSMIAPDLVKNPGSSGSPGTTNPSDIVNTIRSRLLQRRRALSFKMNGVEQIPSLGTTLILNPGSGSSTFTPVVDSDNGPKPVSCTIIEFSNQTWLLVYHVKARYWENNTVSPTQSPIVQNQQGNVVLFNRWSESIDLDDCQFSTKIREGKFVIRSDNVSGKTADMLRSQMAVVGVPDGFLRKNSNYRITPDGLGLQYRITDEEQFKMPPAPAFKAEGEYIKSRSTWGAKSFHECRVKLWGDKETDQSELLDTAVDVVTEKLKRSGGFLNASDPGKVAKVIDAHIRINMYRNEVECMIRTVSAANNFRAGTDKDLSLRVAEWGKNVDTFTPLTDDVEDSDNSPDYLDRGTASLLLQTAAYYDPSLSDTTLGAGTTDTLDNPITNVDYGASQLTHGLQPGQAGTTPE